MITKVVYLLFNCFIVISRSYLLLRKSSILLTTSTVKTDYIRVWQVTSYTLPSKIMGANIPLIEVTITFLNSQHDNLVNQLTNLASAVLWFYVINWFT